MTAIDSSTASAVNLKKALDSCAEEAIHMPGSIQPQGFLIVTDEAFTVCNASMNVAQLLDHDNESNTPSASGQEKLQDALTSRLIGKPLATLLGQKTIEALSSITSNGPRNPIRSTPITVTVHGKSRTFEAIIHRSGEYKIIELEPVIEGFLLDQQDFYQELMNFSLHTHQLSNITDLYRYVVEQVRRVTGFARVKLYVFDEAWNGKVLAESKEDHMPSYLGLSFPESDIPKQARKLYADNYLRLIPNVKYEPNKILPNDQDKQGRPIDLSFSTLRSVSPVHLRYLENMGVKASMSISILQNGRLWGLIACHHHQPHPTSYSIRMLSELIGHNFSAILSTMTENEDLLEYGKMEAIVQELRNELNPNSSLVDALKSKQELILKSVDADGVIINLNGKFFDFGITPSISFAKDLSAWLEYNCTESSFASHCISESTAMEVQSQASASGVLVAPVSDEMTDYVMWFRKELSGEINWAGKPQKNFSSTAEGFRLSPRGSFDLWRETVRGHSEIWKKNDQQAATEVSKLLLKKHYEEKLQKKTENLDSILNNASAIVAIFDANGLILSMNQAAQRTFGVEESDIIGKSLAHAFDKSLEELFKSKIDEVNTTQSPVNFDYELQGNGSTRNYICTKFPLYDVAGDISAICAMSNDITEIKKTERSLIRSNKELERLAYIATHDLQEPLRMISSFTELLNSNYKDNFDKDAEKYMGFILDSSQRMRTLITDLLQYSRVINDNRETPILDTQKELASLLKYLDVLYADQNLTININSPFHKLRIHPEHFNSLLQNLIGNAVKYSRPGIDPVVDIEMSSEDGFWVVSVKDNGIGIAQEHHEKIFLVFQRLHTTKDYPGTGVGLALIRQITERCGGKTWLTSVEGEGSTFYFSIPKITD